MTLTAGTKLGPYEIQSALGAGGMGEVYRARDTRLERSVAIKVLPPELSANVDRKQRFEREARTISSLNHPNICALYDVGSQDGLEFLVLEYVEGETLEKRLQTGPLPAEILLRHGLEIADALEKAHRTGVIHRDLKPANIMLTKTGAKLLDFGLAKWSAAGASEEETLKTLTAGPTRLTEQGTLLGTIQYMAPEQLEGKEADARTDLFAFGEVLYEMATARSAFAGKTKASLIASILSAEPTPISALQPMTPPALERLVRGCLAKDPEERWQTAHDVKLQLLSGERKPYTFRQSSFSEHNGRFSPDGKWAAYCSDESGETKVYVAPFPGPGGKWQVSPGGGCIPIWRRDGKELFYLSSDNKLMAVEVKATGSNFEAGAVHALFETHSSYTFESYDVTADGQRFLMVEDKGEANTAITLFVNWDAELKKK